MSVSVRPARQREYINPRPYDSDAPCVRVVLTETYRDSQHWTLKAYPKGYGRNPEPLLFGVYDADFASERLIAQREGYGIFRLEVAVSLARALTGAELATEQPSNI